MIGNERHLSYHACTGVSLTTSIYLVTRGTSYTTGLHDNNSGVRNSRCTGHMHSTLNETGLKPSQFRQQIWSAAT